MPIEKPLCALEIEPLLCALVQQMRVRGGELIGRSHGLRIPTVDGCARVETRCPRSACTTPIARPCCAIVSR